MLFSHIMLYRAIQHVGPIITTGATCVQPFLTALGAWLLLGEVLMPAQWVGGFALVGSSVILLSLRLGKQLTPALVAMPQPLPENVA